MRRKSTKKGLIRGIICYHACIGINVVILQKNMRMKSVINKYKCKIGKSKSNMQQILHIAIIINLNMAVGCLIIPNRTYARVTPAKPPVMGWSSWNNYHVNIDENMIKSQADAMVANGMKEVGYTYVNIDDGYFGGRDAQGNLLSHPKRFPHGMKSLAEYIHHKGLKAGIYTDAGINTCASIGQQDDTGCGCGLYGHDHADLKRIFSEWNYDFLKVDWCGAQNLGLDEEARYTEISKLIRHISPDAIYNVCRWQFPGSWVVNVADSWRISGDITATFNSITSIIDLNADKWPYCSAGHYNDMDMLQVGRGMNYEEDKTHFTMWCIMVSPLLAGNDLCSMSDSTIAILTNREIIALNQDPLYYQARRLVDDGDLEVWAKPLIHTLSGEIAVVLLNRSNKPAEMSFNMETVGIEADSSYTMRDLWNKKDFTPSVENTRTFTVPAHGVVALRIKGTPKPFNVFQSK